MVENAGIVVVMICVYSLVQRGTELSGRSTKSWSSKFVPEVFVTTVCSE